MASEQPSQPQIVQFGRRRAPPRACVLDHKPHVRSFLAGMLEEMGFVACDCGAGELKKVMNEFVPDLVLLGPFNGKYEVGLLLESLRYIGFSGRVMLFGGRNSLALFEAQEIAERAGFAVLPPLGTPFRDETLKENVGCFLPIPPSPDVPVDAEEALSKGWFEIWYQPKIDPRSLTTEGAEAIVRVRHPNWGLMSPSYYVPGATDPYFRRLSQFVIMRAMADSTSLAVANRPIDISVNLPVPALDDLDFVDQVLRTVPAYIGKRNLQIEVHCADIVDDLPRMQHIAAQLAFRNIGICIDNIGSEGAVLGGRHDLPVTEMKVASRYVKGCADDRIKQAVCAEIIATARKSGARSAAEGVDTQADYLAARALGFDLLQGALFAKPMVMAKFERAVLGNRSAPVKNAV
jgi:EAL domain-containing protein (putative c-di-GMP-specific phosphodiesterase class I)